MSPFLYDSKAQAADWDGKTGILVPGTPMGSQPNFPEMTFATEASAFAAGEIIRLSREMRMP